MEFVKTVLLEKMSSPQIKCALAAGYKTVIIAAGATEQHGPHLPTGTDSMLGCVYAEKLATELGNALVAPVIPVGLSKAFMAFPGSLTFRASTLIAVIEDYISGYIQHGFQTIILLPAHVGNFHLLENFANTAIQKYPGTKIICCFNHELMQTLGEQSYREDGVPANIAGTHAGEAETSLMLAFYSELVDMSLAEEGFVGDFTAVRGKMLDEGVQTLCENGILGDARPANAERGKKIIGRMTKAFADIVYKKNE